MPQLKKDIIGADVQIGTNLAQANLAKLTKDTARYRDENQRLQLLMKKLEVQGKKNGKEWKELKRQFDANKVAIEQNKVKMDQYQRSLGLNSKSMKQLRGDMTRLRRLLNQTVPNTPEWNRYNKELKETSARYEELNNSTKRTQGFLSKLKGAAGGLLPAFGIGAIIGGLVALGKKLFNLANETQKYRQQVQQLTGETGQALADITANIEASSRTFKKEVNEMAVANNTFAKAMDISQQQANKLINKGFLAGADAGGEFLDMLREYPTQFRAAGVSAEQSIALMSQSVKEGIYSDKGPDVIKEGTIRLREMTKATREALAGIGISSTQLETDLQRGTITYFEAIQLVSNKLNELPPQSAKVGTAIADIFGGPGEDAGLDYIKLLGRVETSLDKMVEGSGETAVAQQKLLEANQRLSKAWSDLMGTGTGTFTAIKASAKLLLADGLEGIVKGIAGIRDWFIELYNESLPVRAGLNYMFAVWKTSINLVKTALQTLWEQLKLGGQLIKSVLTFDLEGIQQAFTDWGDNMKTKVVENAKSVGNAWSTAWNETINGRLKPVKQVVEVETRGTNINTQSDDRSGTGDLNRRDELELEVLASKEKFDLLAQQEEEFTQLQYTELEKRKQQNTEWAETELQNIESLKKGQQDLANAKIEAAGSAINALIKLAGEESKLGKALFLLDQARAIGQVIFNTGIANAKAVAASPLTLGQPWVSINTATAAASIATILGQTIARFTIKGKKSGGFADTGDDNEVAGFYHKNEWIANAKAVRNPAVRRFIDVFEIAQRSGNIRQLNMDTILAAVGANIPGRQSGGFGSQPPPAPVYPSPPPPVIDVDKFEQAVDRLMQWEPELIMTDVQSRLRRLEDIEEQTKLN